jgi:hypothetical protein
MPAPFFRLSSELRNLIYELVLLSPNPLSPRTSWFEPEYPSLGLLRVNKAIHREASPLFYGLNTFDFTSYDRDDLDSFFKQIDHNATLIKSIVINFPEFNDLSVGNVNFADHDTAIHKTIHGHCTNLSKIITTLVTTNAAELQLDALDHYKLATEALNTVDHHFHEILSIREVVVVAYEQEPNGYIRQEMKRLGWKIMTVPHGSDSEGAISDRNDYDDDFHDGYSGDNYSGDDEYDVDNDSDFWRRAAD